MNVFGAILDHVSPYSLDGYRRSSREMPLFLLDRVLTVNPHLRRLGPRVERLRAQFAADDDVRQLWRDSEVYGPLVTLLEATADPTKTEELVRHEEILLGLRHLSEIADFPDRVFRLERSHRATFRVSGGRATRLDGATAPVVAWMKNSRTLVYLPVDGLFNDLCPPELYPRMSGRGCSTELQGRLEQAIEVLRVVEPDVMDDFDDLIGTIVLTPPVVSDSDAPGRRRWSYNLRFRYFGGIFLDLHSVDVFAAAEGLIHEYYHQRLWQWFEIEQPSGIPSSAVRVVSPVTGNTREARVMVHAFFIYVAALDLYRKASSSDPLAVAAATPWVESRHRQLARAIPVLYDDLMRAVDHDTMVGQAIEHVMACHAG